jgi:hypothetical protein
VIIKDAKGCTFTQSVVINPVSIDWSCVISEPVALFTCNSAGNTLSTSVIDANSYTWSVSSADNSWVITSGLTSPTLVFTAGNAGVAATFTLTVVKDGCTKTCSFTTSTEGCVVKDNTGGGDPSIGDPCADTTDNTPPTAGTDAEEPVSVQDGSSESGEELTVKAYPNPFVNQLSFEWTATQDDFVQIEILDALGRRIAVIYQDAVQKNRTYKFDWAPERAQDRVFFYRYTSSALNTQGKLFRK